MNVGILTIATGKYFSFVKDLYESIMKNFLIDHNKTFFLFTDQPEKVQSLIEELKVNIIPIKIERKGFPGDTLYRYHHFIKIPDVIVQLNLEEPDVLYYFDADMKVIEKIDDDEVLPIDDKRLIATAHPGFYSLSLGTPETNPKSTAFIPHYFKRDYYWAGGFNGGNYADFIEMSNIIKSHIDEDDSNGIMAIWHDESHLNSFLSSIYEADVIRTLPPSYCYPETGYSHLKQIKAKIIALDKDHSSIRSTN